MIGCENWWTMKRNGQREVCEGPGLWLEPGWRRLALGEIGDTQRGAA